MLDFFKIKNFCSKKGPVKRTKRQAMDWEKIFADHVPEEGLLLRIYEELSKPNSGKTSNPIKKWEKIMNIYFAKEDIHMTKKTHENCSPLGKCKLKP